MQQSGTAATAPSTVQKAMPLTCRIQPRERPLLDANRELASHPRSAHDIVSHARELSHAEIQRDAVSARTKFMLHAHHKNSDKPTKPSRIAKHSTGVYCPPALFYCPENEQHLAGSKTSAADGATLRDSEMELPFGTPTHDEPYASSNPTMERLHNQTASQIKTEKLSLLQPMAVACSNGLGAASELQTSRISTMELDSTLASTIGSWRSADDVREVNVCQFLQVAPSYLCSV